MDLVIVNEDLRQIPRPNALPNCLNVGLTGGIGSGKSTVARLLVDKGASLVDLDALAHALTATNGAAIPRIEKLFGSAVVLPSGALDRDAMRQMIYNDSDVKNQLEAIIHPMLLDVASAKAHELAQTDPVCIVYDIPLLARSSIWQNLLDWVVVVNCPENVRIHRIKIRNPDWSAQAIQKIIASQATQDQMNAIANAVIDNTENDPSHLQLNTQINILFGYLVRQAASRN